MAISPHPTQVLIQQFTSGIGLPFQELLKREIIEDILKEIGVKYKSRIYNPIVIVWSFLSQVLDPDHSCQTPEMVRKEIYVYLLAYNLLRSIMYDAGDTFNHKPIRLSLQATRQHLNNFSIKWVEQTMRKAKKIYQIMLEKVADSYEKRRVGRVEPRVRKRRPKAYPLMQEPRAVLRAKMKFA